MKFKGLTKLALAGAAVAVTGATLATSTYAWYVTNTTAEVSGVSGSTESASVGGNVLVAQANKSTTTYTAQSFTNALTSVTCKTEVSGGLKPVTKDIEADAANSITAVKPAENATGWHDASLTPVATTAAYNEFAFFIASTSKTTINLTIAVDNLTNSDNVKTQQLLNDAGKPTDTTLNSMFTKDAVQALRMEIFQVEYSTATSTNVTFDGSTGSLGVFKVDSFKQTVDSSSAYTTATSTAATQATKPVTSFVQGGNAHTYRQAVMGETTIPGGGSENAYGSATVPSALTVTAGRPTLLVFRYWLEGTDDDCFDSCVSQTFGFAFKFVGADPTPAVNG